MKKNNLYNLCLIIILLLNIQACTQDNNKKTVSTEYSLVDTQAVQMLKEFYTAYILECDKMLSNEKDMENIRTKYLTKELIESINASDLDYDPILNAQDCDKSCINTIEIIPDSTNKIIYTVCYTFVNDEKICIKLSLIKDNGNYLINEIYNSDIDYPSIEVSSKWHKLTVIDNQEFIYHPISALNAVISVHNNTEIDVQYGIEEIQYTIEKIEKIDEYTYFYYVNTGDTIKCKMLSKYKAHWTVPLNVEYIMTNDMLMYSSITELEARKNKIEKAFEPLFHHMKDNGLIETDTITFNK